MADAKIQRLYRQLFADRTISPDEDDELIVTLQSLTTVQDGSLSPPALTPDKLQWMRTTAFNVARNYLDDEREENVKLLKAINAVVHALETTCLLPSLDDDGGHNFSQDAIEELLSSIYQSNDNNGDDDDDGPVVKGAEATALRKFLSNPSTRPPLSELVWLHTTAFRLAAQYLDEGGRKNVALLKSINVIVQIIETICMKPRRLTLDLPPSHSPDANTDFTTAVQTLWNLDSNRLTPHEDYKMDVQNSKHPCDKDDAANDPLFTHVNTQIFATRPTYHAFKQLLDNYTVDTRTREEVTEREREEVHAFLSAIMETAPMKYCHQYCLVKDASYEERSVPRDEDDFVKILETMWFELYSRSGCGFEHVFVGEVKDDSVTGFHNWIQFYLEESKGHIDYRGYMKPRSRDSSAETNDDDHVLTLQFSWKGIEKFVGTSFIGVSPEFEFALYTMAFLTGDEENHVTLDVGNGEAFDLNINCHKYDNHVGSCYVEALAHHD